MDILKTCLLLLPVLLVLAARVWTEWKYHLIQADIYQQCDMTGAAVAHVLLAANNCSHVVVLAHGAHAHDASYSTWRPTAPSAGVITLPTSWYGSKNICAAVVAAHEVGHAVQHNQQHLSYVLNSLCSPWRARLLPAGAACFILAAIAQRMQLGGHAWFFSVSCACIVVLCGMHMVTLWVEAAASALAARMLQARGIIPSSDMPLVRKWYRAALACYAVPVLETAVLSIGVLVAMFA